MSQCAWTLGGLTAAEAVHYRSEIENSPSEQGFYRLRQARVVLAGDGPVLGAVLRAGIDTGWRNTLLFTDDAVPEYRLRDEFQHVVTGSADGIGGHLADADLVVHVSSDIGELIEMCRRCRAANVSVTQVFVRGRDAWLTPVHTAGGRPVEAAWRRLVPAAEPAGPLGGPASALIGAQVALTCFRYLTGASAASEPVLLRLDLASLELTEHRYQWGGPVAEAPAADPLAPAELLDRLPSFVDPHVGLLSAVEQAGVVSWATVEDPRRRWPAQQVLGWAGDPETARVRAVLAAMASYGALAAGPGWVWGTDLVTGDRRQVWLDQPGPAADVGVAAGLCWRDAVAAGLQAHCEARSDPMAATRRWADETTPSDVDTLAKALAVQTGFTPVAVPLNADPAAARLLPFVTKVVLLP
ncbi:hypothetical protein [Kutzneria sp. CA-103260]|uniref:hypothetical protein n=1 Tax=Kutzneria sp. CA-103260 TaxID=2802641 RepID=UPI001BA64B78|nr:hypothetical protein [Kutzneria sp. CA-103260]QUQ68387.1 hypothetical protein JJ691_61320 [Kutzneria sp. CA-103260]